MNYYIDLDALSKFVTVTYEDNKITEKETNTTEDGRIATNLKEFDRQLEIDTTKYNMVNTLLEVFLSQDMSELDFTMGIDRALAKAPTGFRVAVNTLEQYGLIKEFE